RWYEDRQSGAHRSQLSHRAPLSYHGSGRDRGLRSGGGRLCSRRTGRDQWTPHDRLAGDTCGAGWSVRRRSGRRDVVRISRTTTQRVAPGPCHVVSTRTPDEAIGEITYGIRARLVERAMTRRTIARATSLEGVGLHMGVPCRLTFLPAPSGAGIVFRRADLPGSPLISAR